MPMDLIDNLTNRRRNDETGNGFAYSEFSMLAHLHQPDENSGSSFRLCHIFN